MIWLINIYLNKQSSETSDCSLFGGHLNVCINIFTTPTLGILAKIKLLIVRRTSECLCFKRENDPKHSEVLRTFRGLTKNKLPIVSQLANIRMFVKSVIPSTLGSPPAGGHSEVERK